MEIAFRTLTGLFSFLQNSWAPVLVSCGVLWVALRSKPVPGRSKVSHRLFTSAEITAVAMWGFLYGEHWSTRRIPLFDYGAPLLSLVALIAIPLLVGGALIRFSTLIERRGGRALALLSFPFLAVSLVPGSFLVLFYLGMMFSNR